MEESIVLWLPWPPTINAYYKPVRSSLYLSAKGRKYKARLEEIIHEQAPGISLEENLFVEVWLFPPDRRTRDLDNYMKALLDGITGAGIWLDDSQIDQLHLYRGCPGSGIVKVEICEAGPLLQNPNA